MKDSPELMGKSKFQNEFYEVAFYLSHLKKKKRQFGPGVVAHTFNSSTPEAEAKISVNSRSA